MKITYSMGDSINNEDGFTLIEMMVGMAMSLILLAGITSVFTSMGKTSSAVSARTESLGDLYLMSQIMQEELRLSRKTQDSNNKVLDNLPARGVNIASKIPTYPSTDSVFDALPYWDYATRTLTYQNIDGDVGIFAYQYQGNTDAVYWLRAIYKIQQFVELGRKLDVTNGMCVLDANNTCVTANVPNASSIKLLAAYNNEAHQAKTLSLSFMVWPRN